MCNDEDPIDEDPMTQLIFGVESTVMPQDYLWFFSYYSSYTVLWTLLPSLKELN